MSDCLKYQPGPSMCQLHVHDRTVAKKLQVEGFPYKIAISGLYSSKTTDVQATTPSPMMSKRKSSKELDEAWPVSSRIRIPTKKSSPSATVVTLRLVYLGIAEQSPTILIRKKIQEFARYRKSKLKITGKLPIWKHACRSVDINPKTAPDKDFHWPSESRISVLNSFIVKLRSIYLNHWRKNRTLWCRLSIALCRNMADNKTGA